MIDVTKKPFYLNDKQKEWVEETLKSMTIDEKIGQLFCPSIASFDENSISTLFDKIKVGGVMVRPFPLNNFKENIEKIQERSKLPLLIAANLESGGIGAIAEGTEFQSQMGCAATGNPINGYKLGKIATSEASSVGINWAFAPVCDIDKNYHNPITNIRTYGSNKMVVSEFSLSYIKAAREEKVLSCAKHFPGDGIDERDQHLLVSVNSLSREEWMNENGYVYKELIDSGVPTIMVGHIAAPEMAKAINPSISDKEAYFPASISKELVSGVLRDGLSFNGLVVTDSTLMVGYMEKLPRKEALPLSIESGIDMILFNRNLEEDFAYMKKAYEDGRLSIERIDDAVMRILASKAMISLNENRTNSEKNPNEIVGCKKYIKWKKMVADESVTLVKDNKNILPLDPNITKRIYLNVIENKVSESTAFGKKIKRILERYGFEVTLRSRKIPEITPKMLFSGKISMKAMAALNETMQSTEEFISKYDLAMIVLNMETASNATVVRINWQVMFGLGNDIPWYAGEMPLVAVSFQNPYHLLDIPMCDAYINAYNDNDEVVSTTFKKIMGKSEFKGKSPIDPFCNRKDCRI